MVAAVAAGTLAKLELVDGGAHLLGRVDEDLAPWGVHNARIPS